MWILPRTLVFIKYQPLSKIVKPISPNNTIRLTKNMIISIYVPPLFPLYHSKYFKRLLCMFPIQHIFLSYP